MTEPVKCKCGHEKAEHGYGMEPPCLWETCICLGFDAFPAEPSPAVNSGVSPRRLVLTHIHGDNDVVESGGGEPTRWVGSFPSDEKANEYIASHEPSPAVPQKVSEQDDKARVLGQPWREFIAELEEISAATHGEKKTPAVPESQTGPIPEIQVRTIAADDAIAGLNAIFLVLQTRFHDQWDWMKAYFYVETLEAELARAEASVAELVKENRQLGRMLDESIRTGSEAYDEMLKLRARATGKES